MRNRQPNNHYRNFILVTPLVLSVIIRTARTFYFDDDEFFQQGFIVPLEKMAVSEGEDIGCRQWSNQQDFEREMGLQPFTTNKMDSQLCLNYCRIKGYQFAAISKGRTCSCGNKDQSLRKNSPQYRCNVPCTGNIKYRCGGGKGHFQLFKIVTPAGKVGIFSLY